jgi:hypothetical protein
MRSAVPTQTGQPAAGQGFPTGQRAARAADLHRHRPAVPPPKPDEVIAHVARRSEESVAADVDIMAGLQRENDRLAGRVASDSDPARPPSLNHRVRHPADLALADTLQVRPSQTDLALLPQQDAFIKFAQSRQLADDAGVAGADGTGQPSSGPGRGDRRTSAQDRCDRLLIATFPAFPSAHVRARAPTYATRCCASPRPGRTELSHTPSRSRRSAAARHPFSGDNEPALATSRGQRGRTAVRCRWCR